MSAKKPIFDLVRDIAPSVSIATFSNLQVFKKGIISRTDSNFGYIVRFVLELVALAKKKPIFDLVRGIAPSAIIAFFSNMHFFMTGIKTSENLEFRLYCTICPRVTSP